jgi:RNA polymerase subunit RPABC4/transcription elongation factor Spt4
MCGHSPLNHIRVAHNQQQVVKPGLDMERVPPSPQVATRPCPQCGAATQEDFVFCPRCGTELLRACPQCHRAVDAGWSHCAYCGADLTNKAYKEIRS